MVAEMRDNEPVNIVHKELGAATVSYGAFRYTFAGKGWELADEQPPRAEATAAPAAPEPEPPEPEHDEDTDGEEAD